MSGISQGDLGIIGDLAEALGIFDGGSPNTDWFANPDVYLKRILANAQQRAALLNFVDEALGGADNTTEQGVIWVPLVKVPDLPLTLAMTIDESRSDGLYVGVGLKVVTDDPASVSTLSIPLFCARKDGASSTGALVLLGSARGRIKVGTQVTVSGPVQPGQARLGAIGLALELPTGPGADATFGFSLTGLQMPGATTPIDINVQATNVGELDDALLELVLSLVKAQADAPGAPAAIAALGGLLGLKSGDNVPDFPITQLPSLGVHALSAWVLSIVQNDLARNDWLGHIGSLLGGARVGAEVRFALGLPALTLALSLPSSIGASGHTLLQPRLTLRFGNADVRVEAQTDLMSIDLITGQASALPAFSAHAASGRAGAPVLDVTPPAPAPAARAETLRIGFAIDAARKLNFVLAADNVTLGSTDYPVLDLTSPDAVMDAVGNTVADIADELLANLGSALASVQQLLGLSPPAGIPAVTLPALMSDPVGAVAGYWQVLIANSGAATTVLQTLRLTLADASQAAAVVAGTGTVADPWRLPFIGPLALEAVASGSVLSVSLAAGTSVDTLGQRCTVVSTRVAALLARIDLAARSAQLMLGAEASLHARERGVNPPQAKLELSDSTAVLADEVGLKLSWAPSAGLRAEVSLPNPRLVADGLTLPLALPVIGADGLVSLPPAGWDAVQVLVGHLAGLASRQSNFFSEIVAALGWQAPEFIAGGSLETGAALRLADLVSDATGAIKAWLPKLLASDLGPRVLSLVADLLAGSGDLRAVVQGRGTPRDPYRFSAGDDLPEPVLWFPPAGLEPLLVAAPQALRDWRPGLPALTPGVLEAALRAEGLAADDVADLIAGRVEGGIAAGIDALVLRFAGGDGRIAPPLADVPGVDVRRLALAAGQLWPRLDIENITGRVPTTTVHVALGAPALAWPDAPAARLVDLSSAGLEAAMFSLPAAATGDWFVALGTRAACLLPSSSGDGTAEQAARLARWLATLAPDSNDIALVAVAGAGHAARLVADAQAAVTDLVLLGTPLAPISLTTLQTQPAADVLRLMQRLLPALPTAAELADEPLDAPLELGYMLVRALMELEPLADAGADLRPPAVPAPSTRAGLAVTALFGSVSLEQARAALTAIVASGLAARARSRVAASLTAAALPTGVRAGLRWRVPVRAGGTLAIEAHADLSLLAADLSASGVVQRERVLALRLVVSDRTGWLAASPTLSLRAVSLELTLPLDGAAVGSCTLTLHEASVFGQSWERLRMGSVSDLVGVQPVLPEARVLLASLVQRLTADVSGPSSVALADVLEALGLIAEAGGVVANAVDQLVHDPGGLIRQRMVLPGAELQSALAALLGPLSIDIDWATHTVAWQGGSASSGRFGWTADVQLAPGGATGSFHVGPDAALPLVGGLQLRFNLQPFSATLLWHHAGGGSDSALLWPAPDAQALARMLASATPALAAQVALEGLRRADDAARPLIDAALDALGFLSGAAADAERSLRPLAGFVRDPLGWLGSSAALAAQPVKLQGLFDAMRPLMGLTGAAGTPLPLAPGVSLSASAEGGGARLALTVDPSVWAAADPAAARLAGGIAASLVLQPGAAPGVALGLNLGLAGVPAGQQAVHVTMGNALDANGVQIFLRPSSGADIPLLPFAGLGALSAAAAAALPYLLDRLAERPAPVGPLVAALGDALQLRSGAPAAFSGAALQAWAVNPVESLRDAATPMVTFGLQTLANALDAFVPADISVTHSAGTVSVSRGAFTLGFAPATHAVSLACNALAVPGIETLTAALVISDLGLRELSFTLGPAAINAGGVFVRPFVTVAAGDEPTGGARVLVGLAGSAGSSVAGRWLLSPAGFAIVAADGLPADAADFVAVLIDLAAAVALAQPKVDELLDSTVSGALTVRNLLRGVVLADVANPDALIANLFVPAQIPLRVRRLFSNLADGAVTVTIDDLSVSFMNQAGSIGLQIGLVSRLAVPLGEVSLWIENDDSWITSNPSGDGGLFVGFLDAAAATFQPKLVVNGLGLRLGKSSGPLIDVGLTIESVALHVFADIGPAGVAGAGVQLQFANLAVPAGGAGGDNGIAQGLMRDTGPTPPKPAFSPALAVQKHNNGSVAVSLRAGDPPGPWWIAIQKGFGPLYLEQVGFDARLLANGKLERVSVLMDGSVSLFGLTCAVDDLQVTYFTADGDFLNAANWKVDLAGLAVSADMAGLSIAGGLLKQETTNAQGALQTEYLGMLLGRFAVYGLTIYGGYGEGVDAQGNKFTAFFAIGAVNGPIGGPPAFFLTGIGGGFGINRLMKLPTDLSKFGDYPLIQALDIAASPSDPMQQLRALGSYFPMSKGTFWFAAGLSFNSFALVDGIAVVGVQIGDGLDINLMGLARMALPRPQVALVSIEVALIVRFSSSEGVLWVQGQLTDNSWLLYEDIKLTGGFAYVIWFKGERAGEFVLTLGGYHPDFKRAGYPVVPRLGLRWSIGSSIVIKAGSYFALTSEALMAGGDFEASAKLGPAWAEVKWGAHGIVYFDPFSYSVSAYARIAAGVTLDLGFFGEITFSVNLGARIQVEGPDFRGSVTFEIGPLELTFEFGGSDKAGKVPISADAFVTKYLERADSGAARAHALMTSFGALPSKGEDATPDGSSARPFVVVVEFGLTFTTTVPAVLVTRSGVTVPTTRHDPSRALAVGPMGEGTVEPEIVITWQQGGTTRPFPFAVTARPFSRFPVGVWGPAGDMNNRKVPKADMVEALSELDLACVASPTGGGPEIPYFQVEIGKRLPLPFARAADDINALRLSAKGISALVVEPITVDAAFGGANKFLARTASPTALAALRGERQAPPRLGTLAEGLESPTQTVAPKRMPKVPGKVYDHVVDAPRAVGLFASATVDMSVAAKSRTTVKGSAKAWRVAPPTLAAAMAERSRSVPARLLLVDAPAVAKSGARRSAATFIGAGEVPLTAMAHAPTAIVARTGAPLAAPLAEFNAALAGTSAGPRSRTNKAARRGPGAQLAAGECVVLKLPNAKADAAGEAARPQLAVAGAPARVVLLDIAGRALADVLVGTAATAAEGERLSIPRGTECIVAIGQGLAGASTEASAARAGLAGWHAGLRMPYVGHGSAIGPGCIVHSTSDHIAAHAERAAAGWVSGAELARGITTVSTRFATAPRTVIVVVDDPAVTGRQLGERQLLLGLDGADRATDAAGIERAPVLMTMDNRSLLAYEVVPDLSSRVPKRVQVSVASDEGWSLVAVMGTSDLDPQAALNLIAARGLQAALAPLAPRSATASDGGGVSRLDWIGPVRSPEQQRAARARASGVAVPPAPRALSRRS